MPDFRPQTILAAVVLALMPTSAAADRGEGCLSLGALGNLSFLRNPQLQYDRRLPRMNAGTLAIQSRAGIGVTDWLEAGVVARFVLPVRVIDSGVSAQGFPRGEAVYDMWAIQTPLTMTARYSWGAATTIGLSVEAGLECARWSLTSHSAPSSSGSDFGVDSQVDWSTSFLLGLEPMMEWRHFDHFSFRVGPRLTLTTTGSMQVGMALEGALVWGVGFF